MTICLSKKLRIALALLGAALFLSGCPASDSAPSSKKPNPNILRFDVAYPFGPFVVDPVIQAGSSHAMPFLFSYLAVPDQDGNLQPDLAEKWAYDENTFTWTFDLRTNARFYDGKPVTAQDAAFSIKIFTTSLLPELYAKIRSIDPVSDAKLQVRLSNDDPKVLEKFCDIEIFQAPPNPDQMPKEFLIGSGPFRLKEKTADRIILEANADYFRGKPSIDAMIFTYVPSQEEIWARLMAGESDVASEITPENVPITEACEGQFYLNRHCLPCFAMLLFNAKDPLFSDARVRKALALAIDREYIVQKILHGNAVAAAGPMGLDPRYHNPQTAPLSHDPKKAMELLAQAGWKPNADFRMAKNGKFFEFTVYVAEELPTHQKVAQHLRLCFNDVGIRLYVQMMPSKELIRSYYGGVNFQAVISEINGANRTFDHLKFCWTKTNAACSDIAKLEDARLNELFEALEAQSDPEAQKKLFYAIEARIFELAPAAFLYHETVCDVMSKRFDLPGPFYISPNRGWNLQFASLKKQTSGN